MKTFTICAALVAMLAVSACVKHERETVIEQQQPPNRTTVVVPPQ
jgi:hypothetical protein